MVAKHTGEVILVDLERCHEVTCSANHYLVNEVCVGLYPYSGAMYTVAFELRLFENPYINNDTKVAQQMHSCYNHRLHLNAVIWALFRSFSSELHGKPEFVSVISWLHYAITTKSCDNNRVVFNNTESPTLSVSITYLFQAFRDKNINGFEKILLEWEDRLHSINPIYIDGSSYKECKILLQASPTAMHMIPKQKDVHLQNQTEHCQYSNSFDTNTRHQIETLQPHDITIVDRFMLCPQLEFGTDEYSYNSTTHTVTITNSRVTFELGYFKMLGDAIRVCLDDYKTKIKQVIAKNKAKNEACQSFGKTEIEILLIGIVLAIGTNGMFP